MSQQQSDFDPAEYLAHRFIHLRTEANVQFFDALCKHIAPSWNNECIQMWFEFGLSTNERGRTVADLMAKHTNIKGARYLDVGCASAGFLVAFHERGAKVAGIELEQDLINLAKANFADHRLDAPLICGDALDTRITNRFRRSVDILTCYDVIEHVKAPDLLVRNISKMLSAKGTAYFEIPNAYSPTYIVSDGHFKKFGITLLEHDDARTYFHQWQPTWPYRVGHYLRFSRYQSMFNAAGLNLELLPETFSGITKEKVLDDLARLKASIPEGLASVPSIVRDKVESALNCYLGDLNPDRPDFLTEYGVESWKVIARHKHPLKVRLGFS